MKLKHFIKIKTAEMNKESRAIFYSAVSDTMPDLITTVNLSNDDGEPTKSKMFYKHVDNGHWYIVPLSSNPTIEHLDALGKKLSLTMNVGNFVVESSLIELAEMVDNYVSETEYDQIAEQFAKALHDSWMSERLDKGWRYGDIRNDAEKTHPLIKEWSRLNDGERDIKPNVIKEFINILQNNGFKISKK